MFVFCGNLNRCFFFKPGEEVGDLKEIQKELKWTVFLPERPFKLILQEWADLCHAEVPKLIWIWNSFSPRHTGEQTWNILLETLTDTAPLALLISSDTSTCISWFSTLLDKHVPISPTSPKCSLSNMRFPIVMLNKQTKESVRVRGG